MMTRRQIDDLPFNARQMFDLVADIKRYPEFVPYCKGLRILKEDRDGHQRVLLAEMLVQYKVFREKFKCRVVLNEETYDIAIHHIEGPVKKLDSLWQFTDNDETRIQQQGNNASSKIEFEVDYEFKSIFMQTVSNTVFEKIFTIMWDAFIARAHDLYGSNSS